MKNNHYSVQGRFYIDVHKIISAKSESEAIRKARDYSMNNRKIKKKDWAKDEAQAIEID